MDHDDAQQPGALKSHQKKYLRGLAHAYKPVVLIGQKGVSDHLLASVNQALDDHELIKVKFIDFKEKAQKKSLIEEIQRRTGADLAGLIGHTALFYRPHPMPDKRRIHLPA